MSYNPNVAYSGPDGATRSVTNELTARFGYPARPYEFVTGWKDAGNVSGHNPDSNGITHGVDIFMTDAQNRWAADHLAARGRAGDKRVAYVIYAGQIASPSTGYYFAGSGWEHWDHPHLSVWDGYWGGYCSLPASIYNDTSSWGIATLAGQANTTTPIIKKDWSDMATKEEVKQAFREVLAENLSGTKAAKTAGTLGWAIMNGRDHAQLANNGAKANGQALANVAAQTAAIKALSAAKPGLDPAAVQASIDKAVQAALKDLSVTLSVEADK